MDCKAKTKEAVNLYGVKGVRTIFLVHILGI